MLKDEVEAIYAMLGSSAGVDPVSDSRLVGRIAATKAILEMQYEDVVGEAYGN